MGTGRNHSPSWRPTLGACPADDGFQFRVWAPARPRVDVVIETGSGASRRVSLDPEPDGFFSAAVGGVRPGARYGFAFDAEGPYPDPASRWQPDGVHALSATVDPRSFRWSDSDWKGLPLDQAVFYELHVGTFTLAGTFAGAIERLPDLAELGVTAIELMPVADFPGACNWGYDGVSLFAPARCYGDPDDLRRLVDTAHRLGLAVVLDVVYNHFGPDGAYLFSFSPHYASTSHKGPWGASVNLDGPHCGPVRAFFIENALHWLHEYHFDGLRLDATHAMVDDSPRHFVAELTERVRASLPGRTVLLVAEDDRNLAAIVESAKSGGWGCDAVWADDFHHQVRRLAAGDRDGYYQDFTGTVEDVAATVRAGWFFHGQHSAYRDEPRGTDPAGVPPNRMVVCVQNHDQIGNRAFGERLNHQVAPALFRALSAVLLCAPETPLLFMGQEWAASTPFQFFTDHNPELGRLVTEGRRREFARFATFSDEETRRRIPDPQARATFEASRLRWTERADAPHAGMLALYRALIALRRSHPAMAAPGGADAIALDADTLGVTRGMGSSGPALLLVARLQGAGAVQLGRWSSLTGHGAWNVVMTTEDPSFVGTADDGSAARPRLFGTAESVVTFARPSAIILEAR